MKPEDQTTAVTDWHTDKISHRKRNMDCENVAVNRWSALYLLESYSLFEIESILSTHWHLKVIL